MQHFYSHGKLLLTAEYVVLDGANALALPTKFGQTLTVESIEEQKLVWKSLNHDNEIWFEEELSLRDGQISSSISACNNVSKRLIDILNKAKRINPEFLKNNSGYKVTSKLQFPNDWGLGSSSTLLNNIAQWAKVDAFTLSNATFGGSGYDIACAQNDSAIIYQLENSKPIVERTLFKKSFEDELFFIHLNRKQNSRDSIKTYKDNKSNSQAIISRINTITTELIASESIDTFNNLIEAHETLIGEITNQTPIKKRLFNDFKNQIKSLGGWNGDFVLVTGKKHYINTYFKNKGYNTIVSFKDMILQN
ncbi:GYDIA family GHMP kinase [Lacinutrix jangbogonensis]|uniref:GYDIA family GHMP kinase n=1 Tax=Lacinutrix jangbogonensis TaxID=1469557 RepID=UPI00053D7B7A|nr:GYDIA family GHMP kinase [Lacinutrix jangbogonensis]